MILKKAEQCFRWDWMRCSLLMDLFEIYDLRSLFTLVHDVLCCDIDGHNERKVGINMFSVELY